jgi:hypothetical protein
MTKRIGSYEVLDPIGEGGMGAVYRGRDPRFDRLVAIKVLHSQFQRDPGVVERFKAEAVIQAKLSHPHIVTVLDFVAGSDTLAIVMEYVDGQPLDTLIEQAAGPLPVERTVRLMDQVLSAMGYAHKRGLVHRDIKPSNILVQPIEGQEYAKVMDFGIAKILGSEKVRTATGAKMGTLAYMSPEQIQSPRSVEARSDIYSLGVVLYEMLTGRLPFDAESEYELMRQAIECPMPEVRAIVPGCPPALSRVVAQATLKRPADRYSDCDEMWRALRAAVPAIASTAGASPDAAGGGRDAAADVRSRGLNRMALAIGAACRLLAAAGAVALLTSGRSQPAAVVSPAASRGPSQAVAVARREERLRQVAPAGVVNLQQTADQFNSFWLARDPAYGPRLRLLLGQNYARFEANSGTGSAATMIDGFLCGDEWRPHMSQEAVFFCLSEDGHLHVAIITEEPSPQVIFHSTSPSHQKQMPQVFVRQKSERGWEGPVIYDAG